MIVEGVHGSMKVGSDNSMDSCPINTQGNSANADSICEAMEQSNPWTNKQGLSLDLFHSFCSLGIQVNNSTTKLLLSTYLWINHRTAYQSKKCKRSKLYCTWLQLYIIAINLIAYLTLLNSFVPELSRAEQRAGNYKLLRELLHGQRETTLRDSLQKCITLCRNWAIVPGVTERGPKYAKEPYKGSDLPQPSYYTSGSE